MAFNKEDIQQALEIGFARIESEASANNPATKIVAETIVAAIEKAFQEAEVTATATIDNKTINIQGELK